MALYFPAARLAIQIIDDPESAPVERDAFPNLTVIGLTRDDLADPGIMRHLPVRGNADALRDPAWRRRVRMGRHR
ncbi:MAG: hypothetical protein SOY67_01735 [Collinsella sp.]|nr:hypothetical protein [Collinsella sp.]